MPTTISARDAKLAAIYAQLPTIDCQRKCQEYCGPIAMANAEWQRIRARTDGNVEAERWQPHGDGRVAYSPVVGDDLRCPLLTADGACSVYDVRPIICRLYGMTMGMVCPWGCKPSRWLSDTETRAFIDAVEAVA